MGTYNSTNNIVKSITKSYYGYKILLYIKKEAMRRTHILINKLVLMKEYLPVSQGSIKVYCLLDL